MCVRGWGQGGSRTLTRRLRCEGNGEVGCGRVKKFGLLKNLNFLTGKQGVFPKIVVV